MSELRAPALRAEDGERLALPDYRRDFRARRAVIRDGESWKLERLQHFEEANPRRDALRRGDWSEALRLFEAERTSVREAAQDDEKHGHSFRRLRVIEEPLTPYVQWELHWLHLRAECGYSTRVMPAEVIAASEAAGHVPEVVILDEKVLYQVLYTDTGVTRAAIRFTDPAVVAPWATFIRDAYTAAEDITAYFPRALLRLPPPPAA
ncbi:DUF6879 family protein [Streptomyces sp. NBC_01477]|uniref:DUF6879 family protein n=1 Tax=Streptomyces sp. NBC_01477 TaxID=2976015 RepID=UPI002E36AC43|nr:DUF6879 family protein [Streptomyces sp. NBC_01477]